MFHREERARRQESEVDKTQSWGSAVTTAEKPGLQESHGSGSAGGCLLFPKVGASTSKLQRGARSCFTKPLRFGKAWHTASRGSSTCQPISSLQLTLCCTSQPRVRVLPLGSPQGLAQNVPRFLKVVASAGR